MIQKIPSPIPNYVRVQFKLPSWVWADRIYLTGEFNQWDAKSTPLRQERDGSWQAMLDLPANQIYEFHYLIDGHSQTDYHADGFATDTTASPNSIVRTVLPKGAPDVPTIEEVQPFQRWLPAMIASPTVPAFAATSSC